MPKRSQQSSQENEPKPKKVRFAGKIHKIFQFQKSNFKFLPVFTDAESFFVIDNFANTYYRCKSKKERLEKLVIFEKSMEKVGFNRSSEEIEVKNYSIWFNSEQFWFCFLFIIIFFFKIKQGRLLNLKAQYKISLKEQKAGFAVKWKFFDTMDELFTSLGDQNDK